MAVGIWWKAGVAVGMVGLVASRVMKEYGWEKEEGLRVLAEWSQRLGVWAIPAYVAIHAIALALCLPFAVFFEAAASLLFGFVPAVLCVFSAKLLGASLSFWIGRSSFLHHQFDSLHYGIGYSINNSLVLLFFFLFGFH